MWVTVLVRVMTSSILVLEVPATDDELVNPDGVAKELGADEAVDGLELPGTVAGELAVEDEDGDESPLGRQLSRSKAIVPRMGTKRELI